MKKPKLVHVEIGDNGLPIRIFRNKDWLLFPEEKVQIMDRGKAVGAIRAQVYDRNAHEDDLHECGRCGRLISWESFEMNERRPKGAGGGKTGGEVSLENC